MQKIQVPVGISDFKEIREKHLYYVDKTDFIKELLSAAGEKVTLFTRPRRFGKTLCMRMLSEFFDIRKDSASIFEGLKISNEKAICKKWMNQMPTVFMTFKSVSGLEFEQAYAMLVNTVSSLFKQHSYLLTGDVMNPEDQNIFRRITDKTASYDEFNNSLYFLSTLLQLFYGKPVMLFIDEYDVPLAKAEQNGYYRKMLDVIGALLGNVLKDNSALERAVITGCLKIAKESIFTGTNNFVSDTIMHSRYDEYFGFTETEVRKLLSACHLENHFADIKDWYDGYRFGHADVYCPWDVMNYVNALCRDEKALPQAYWNNTSDNAIVRELIRRKKGDVVKRIETLMAGGRITEMISAELTYDMLYSSEQNLWSVLYLTGYLTQEKVEAIEGELWAVLKIPNKEVSYIFRNTIQEWFRNSTETWNRNAMFAAIWNKNADAVTIEMTKLLRKTISYHDYKEDFYHAFLAGIFAGAGYAVESNREHGDGRSDVVISDIENGRIAVFEIKYSKQKTDLQEDCERAIRQIDTMRYAEEYFEDYDEILCYGISFFRKQCQVMLKNE